MATACGITAFDNSTVAVDVVYKARRRCSSCHSTLHSTCGSTRLRLTTTQAGGPIRRCLCGMSIDKFYIDVLRIFDGMCTRKSGVTGPNTTATPTSGTRLSKHLDLDRDSPDHGTECLVENCGAAKVHRAARPRVMAQSTSK